MNLRYFSLGDCSEALGRREESKSQWKLKQWKVEGEAVNIKPCLASDSILNHSALLKKKQREEMEGKDWWWSVFNHCASLRALSVTSKKALRSYPVFLLLTIIFPGKEEERPSGRKIGRSMSKCQAALSGAHALHCKNSVLEMTQLQVKKSVPDWKHKRTATLSRLPVKFHHWGNCTAKQSHLEAWLFFLYKINN